MCLSYCIIIIEYAHWLWMIVASIWTCYFQCHENCLGMPNFMELPARLSAASTRACHHCLALAMLRERTWAACQCRRACRTCKTFPTCLDPSEKGELSIDYHGSPWITMDHHGSPWITMDHHGSHGPTSSITRHPRHYKAFKISQAIATWLSHDDWGSFGIWFFMICSCPLGKAFKVFRVFKAGTWTLHALRHVEPPAGPMLVPCGTGRPSESSIARWVPQISAT